MLGKKLFERYQAATKEITGSARSWHELAEIERHSWNVAADGLLIDMPTGDTLSKLIEASQRQRTLSDDPKKRYQWEIFINDLHRILAWWGANLKPNDVLIVSDHRELRTIKAELIGAFENAGMLKAAIAITNCQALHDLDNVCMALFYTPLADFVKQQQELMLAYASGGY